MVEISRYGKYRVKKFVEYITEDMKQLYASLLQHPIIGLTAVLKRKYKIKTSVSVSKSFLTQIIER